MRRRDFVKAIGGAAAAWPFAARAQQPVMPGIGFLGSGSSATWASFVTKFRQGLNETGFVEGRNVTIEFRWAEGQYDRLPALAADLVNREVSVIFASGGSAPAQSAKAATAKIPIIFESGGDPVRAGLVASLNRPGGNVTGVSWIASALQAKRLEILHQLVPKALVIGALVNSDYPDANLQQKELQEAASAMKQQIRIETANTEPGIDVAFATLVRQGADAFLIANDPFFAGKHDKFVALSVRYAVPTIYAERTYVAAGGLMSYGTNLADMFRPAGVYVGRVLKGEKPADLPVIQPTKFELVINLKTAKSLGLEIPPTLLALADDVIEQ